MDEQQAAATSGSIASNSPSVYLAAFLCLSSFMATTPVFPLAPRLFDAIVAGVNVRTFTLVAGFAVLALGTTVLLRLLKHPAPKVTPARIAAMTLLYAIALIAGFILMPAMGSALVAVPFGIVLGAGILGAFVAWGSAVSMLASRITSFGALLALLCTAMAAAAAADMALIDAGATTAALLAALLIACGAAFPFAVAIRHGASAGRPDEDKATLNELLGMAFGIEGADHRADLPVPGAMLPFAILLLYAASQLVTASIEGYQDLSSWGVLAAPVIALVPCAVRDDSRRIAFALRILLPFLGVVLLGATLLLPDRLEAGIAALGAQTLCFSYGLALLSLTMFFSAARAPHTCYAFAVAAAMVLSAVMVLPHLTFGLLRVTAAMPVLVVILVMAVCLLVASPSVVAWNGTFDIARVAGADSDTLAQKIGDACEAMADAYNLSPRERELLHYLGRGYGPRYLATILPIKENTIRSHVRNIYAKTDVHTQPELLELIDSFAGRP